jgi:hypothetical protein
MLDIVVTLMPGKNSWRLGVVPIVARYACNLVCKLLSGVTLVGSTAVVF